jgi:hypothetical protein
MTKGEHMADLSGIDDAAFGKIMKMFSGSDSDNHWIENYTEEDGRVKIEIDAPAFEFKVWAGANARIAAENFMSPQDVESLMEDI